MAGPSRAVRSPLLAVLAGALLALGAAAPASAQDPFSPLPPAPPAPQAPQPVQTGRDDDGLEGWGVVALSLAGGAVLLGIAFFIVRDARRAAPTDERDRPSSEDRPKGTRPPPERRVKKGRAKARAARAARKRNR